MMATALSQGDPSAPDVVTSIQPNARPHVRGKFIFVGDEKFYVRGVTYGTFRSDGLDGGHGEHGSPASVEHDFIEMAANGINALRTYTVPPRWLLDCAQRHDLFVMVGLPWEQHVAFLDLGGRSQEIVQRLRESIRDCSGHPAILCYAIGNEIPASIVRWHGAQRVERFLQRLYQAVKAEDPGTLVTYVNFPTTEYLQLPFIDFVTFNVYLEAREQLERYLARLQNIAGDRPLVMAEIGLDSRRNGEDLQARTLDWQVSTAFTAGCAGAFVFAWTDEWHRGGSDIEDWDFGLTRRDRSPKPALSAVRRAFADVPFAEQMPWPRVSVVICSFNGARTIRDTLNALTKLDYPDYEVIVVDDGSTDDTAEIAREYPFRLIRTENRGLSSARNTGLWAATGEIIAYIDDDAWPDCHWLKYLAASFLHSDHAAIGGPNIAPPGDGSIADCVVNAPGGPTHVLLTDQVAEHVPGCNMAVRRSALAAIGGFDPRFRTAGDDVDVCWRLQQRGWTLGFNPVAMVWHHRRNSVRTYWRQQVGYGRAEAQLEDKWPEKYNGIGHLHWSGRMYGAGLTAALSLRSRRIYHGMWGTALFQSVYQPAPGLWSALPQMPEWHFLVAALCVIAGFGLIWPMMLWALPFLLLAIAAPVTQALMSGRRAIFPTGGYPRMKIWALRGLTAALHLLQPLARLDGRISHGLCPWRRRGIGGFTFPRTVTLGLWSERWASSEDRLCWLQDEIHASGARVVTGSDLDPCDLHVRLGLVGRVSALLATEEHGNGKQLVRLRVRPSSVRTIWASVVALLLVALVIAMGGEQVPAILVSVAALAIEVFMLYETGRAMATVATVFTRMGEPQSHAMSWLPRSRSA